MRKVLGWTMKENTASQKKQNRQAVSAENKLPMLAYRSFLAPLNTIEKFAGKWGMLHPDYIVKNLSDIPEYEAVYPLTAGLSGKVLSKAMTHALAHLPIFQEWQDEAFMKKQGFSDWKTSVLNAHNPKVSADLAPDSKSRLRLAYDELLANQLALFLARAHHKRQKGICFKKSKNFEDQVLVNGIS